MPRLTRISWKKLECIFQLAGYTFYDQKGSHRKYKRSGSVRPIIIPRKKEIAIFIIKENMKTAKMSNADYFDFLSQC